MKTTRHQHVRVIVLLGIALSTTLAVVGQKAIAAPLHEPSPNAAKRLARRVPGEIAAWRRANSHAA